MIAITCLMAVFLAAINIANGVSSASDARSTLKMIIEQEVSSRPDAVPAPPNMSGETQDTLAAQRYFFVRTAEEGKIIYTDLSHISSVDEDMAASFVEKIESAGRTDGRLHGYLYSVENSGIGGGHIYAFLDERRVIASNLRTLAITFVLGAVLWGLMLALVIFLSGKAIRPVAESMEKQKRFISDAGHEFKTPLAIIRANAEVLELHTGKSKWLTNITEQVDRMTRLTTNLLTLTKMEEGPDVVAPSVFDASALLMETLRPYEASFDLKKIRTLPVGPSGPMTRTESPRPLFFSFRRDWYIQLLTILFDNAVKYTAGGTDFHIAVAPGKQGVESLTPSPAKEGSRAESPCRMITVVLDTISASSLTGDPDRLFDRFYRADEARTQKSGGSGIGLAVARAITDHADSEITCTYLPENHIRFTLHLKAM